MAPTTAGGVADDPPVRDDDIRLKAGGVELDGHLMIPEQPVGIVLFAHGSGSGRHSPRNRFVASTLNAAGLGTLLMDLLTTEEEADRANVFDVDLLATRLAAATRQLSDEPGAAGLPVGYFGASTGAAAALWTASALGASIGAVVSRGGRPDLAGPRLADVVAPTLLIVGGADPVVLDLNQQARARLGGPSQLVVVPGATHLFEEPGALEKVAGLARDWFLQHLQVGPGAGGRPTDQRGAGGTQVEVTEVPSQPVALVRRLVPMAELTSFFGEAFATVAAAVSSSGRSIVGPPFRGTTDAGRDDRRRCRVPGRCSVRGRSSDVVSVERPGGRVAVALHVGPTTSWPPPTSPGVAGRSRPHDQDDMGSTPQASPDPSTWRTRLICPLQG